MVQEIKGMVEAGPGGPAFGMPVGGVLGFWWGGLHET